MKRNRKTAIFTLTNAETGHGTQKPIKNSHHDCSVEKSFFNDDFIAISQIWRARVSVDVRKYGRHSRRSESNFPIYPSTVGGFRFAILLLFSWFLFSCCGFMAASAKIVVDIFAWHGHNFIAFSQSQCENVLYTNFPSSRHLNMLDRSNIAPEIGARLLDTCVK